MKYIPQKDDVITLINNDKTIKSYHIKSVISDDLCLISGSIPLLIYRNEFNVLIYNVKALDIIFNVYDIKRNNEFVINNHDVFVYVKES